MHCPPESRAPVALALVALGALVAVLGCEPARCVDLDGDGFGPSCALGADCDELNAARTDDCDVVPPPDCALDPTATGCPCLPGTVVDCYAGGDPSLDGVGLCHAGRALCLSRFVGACSGAVAPLGEICDGLDQDCDGIADDGVLSPCGGCDASCSGGVWGEGPDPFVGDAAAGTDTTPLGHLTLARVATERNTVFVANSAEGTLSRIDDGEPPAETARYLTGGLEPSRVAVDWNGDAWVANREFDGVSSVTHVAGDRARCIDRDGSGTIETSGGASDVRAFGDDECVLGTTPVGALGEIARALAIDGDRGLDDASGGNAWVGLHDGQAIVVVDGLTGDVLRRVETPGFSPYAAAFDPWGRLWMSSRDGLLLRLDPSLDPPEPVVVEVPLSCWLLYSLAIDEAGRIALTGFSCDRVTVYDPTTERWTSVATEPSPRGAIFASDGRLFVTHTGGLLSELSLSPLRVRDVRALGSSEVAVGETIGIGATSSHVWAIAREGERDGPGRALRAPLDGGPVDAVVDVGAAPHTQGDLTGAELGSAFVPEGAASHVFPGCAEGMTIWTAVHVAADPGSAGRVELELRHAESEAALAGATFVPLGAVPGDPSPPFPLAVPDGGVLEVRVRLTVAGRIGAPRLERIGVEWVCPGPD